MNKSVSKDGLSVAKSSPRLRRVAVRASSAVAVFALLLSAQQPLFAQQPLRVPQPTRSPAAQRLPTSVTLVTGDRVVVSGAHLENVSIRRAPGRENVRFLVQRVAASKGRAPHLLVLPEDAVQLVASGKADRRLFDISLLIEYGYDDAHRATLPFIVTYASAGSQLTARSSGVVPGAVVDRSLSSVNGLAVSASKARVQEVWSSFVSGKSGAASARAVASEPIAKIWLDGLLQPVLDRSVPQIGAPAAWALGYQGDGITVAVLDTGVDVTHPDLIDNPVLSANFTEEPDGDQVGHGTHVASIIAGSGAAEGGKYRGVAPGALLLSGKVCEVFGCPESSIIAGMQWAVADQGAEVVNLSLGGTDAPGLDPLEQAVSTLSEQYGALFVIAAGNSGPDPSTVESPGASAAALTVGAVDHDDVLAYFSSRGMTTDLRIKPDLTAPGVDIVAAKAAGTELGTPVGDAYVSLSGTSMATPHAAGAVALLLDAHPEWTPADAKAALMGSAAFNTEYTALEQGAGRVDIAAALGSSFLANVTSLSFGLARWPHGDDAPVTRTVTYRNSGPAVDLELALDVRGPEGVSPPGGMFTVTPSLVTLPENGSVSVRVTANTILGAADGVYSGRLIASDGTSHSLAIPLAVNREVESYDLTVRHLDRQGAPTMSWFSNLFSYQSSIFPWVSPPSQVPEDVTLRLPKGRYAFESYIFDPEDFSQPETRVVAPNQLLDADRLLVMDASAAAPVILNPPRPELESYGTGQTWGIVTDLGGFTSGLFTGGYEGAQFYQAEIDPRAPEMLSELDGLWLDPVSTPQESHAAVWTAHGHLPSAGTHFVERITPAIVNASYAASLRTPQPLNDVSVGVYIPQLGGSVSPITVELPFQRTEYYYSEDPDVRWWNELWMHDDEYVQSIILGWVGYDYIAGESIDSHWNEPVFSPVLPDLDSLLGDWGSRSEDTLSVAPPMYGDRAQHAGFIASQGTTLLYRNGEKVGEQPYGDGGSFDVPPERATYRLELEHSQEFFELTQRQSVAWTFESGHAAEGHPERLPLLVVRFAPELDALGRAPSGAFDVPLYVDPYGQASSSLDCAPSVEVSFDDGKSWSKASVEADGVRWKAHVQHPAGAGYVSLRTSARDVNGNAVEQTLIRAYALGQ